MGSWDKEWGRQHDIYIDIMFGLMYAINKSQNVIIQWGWYCQPTLLSTTFSSTFSCNISLSAGLKITAARMTLVKIWIISMKARGC